MAADTGFTSASGSLAETTPSCVLEIEDIDLAHVIVTIEEQVSILGNNQNRPHQ